LSVVLNGALFAVTGKELRKKGHGNCKKVQTTFDEERQIEKKGRERKATLVSSSSRGRAFFRIGEDFSGQTGVKFY